MLRTVTLGKTCVFAAAIILAAVALGCYGGRCYRAGLREAKPSSLLRFQPVCEGSDPLMVKAAQAELVRHELYYGKIDGECGKQTALAICKLLVMIEEGYKVKTIYEHE